MCPSCAQKQQLATNRQALVIPSQQEGCKYTVEQLVNKLYELNLNPTQYSVEISYIRSALNFYEKDCNRFNSLLDGLI